MENPFMSRFWLTFILLASSAGHAGTIIETETPKRLAPNGTLGTCRYKPTPTEQAYFQKLDGSEMVTGSFLQPYSIHTKKDRFISWFAIVRGIATDPDVPGQYRLLLEQKYFDGMTDCHIMLVSVNGAGDFEATVSDENAKSIPLLSLVRVYGKVVEETNDTPRVEATYIRVWPWLAFTLTDLGAEDHSNPRWRKLCRPCKSGRVYKPYPDEDYYRGVLGDPKDFAGATAAKDKPNP
jgi:hypothetical protein